MAWNFGVQINSLTGFDGNLDSASEEGDNYTTLANQWLNDAAREVINILPDDLKEKCITSTTLNNSTPTLDLDTDGSNPIGKIISVLRERTDSGPYVECMKVPLSKSSEVTDSTSMYYASATNPVYYVDSLSDSSKLNVYPTPTSTQNAIVHHIGYPTVDHSHSDIANFPNEAEYLVPLRAAITALEYKLNFEEDIDLYINMIDNLKNRYEKGILALQTGKMYTPKKKDKDDD